MDSVFLTTNTAKVNKIITVILYVVFIASLILFFAHQVPGEVVGSLFIELAVATFLIVRTERHKLTMAILFLGILTCTVQYIGSTYTGMIVVTVLCVVSLYLDKGILFSFGGLYGIAFTVMYYTTNHKYDVGYFSIIGFLALTVVILFFVCKRSAGLIELSNKNESDAKELLNSMNVMVRIIQENTLQLDNDINKCNKDMIKVRDISNLMSEKIKDIADDVVDQSKSMVNISHMMNTADEEMSGINLISKDLYDTSRGASKILLRSAEHMNRMDEQMDSIEFAVSESLTTVENLNESMNQITRFLASINQIAKQSNLLAINASIEAARTGSAGAGFLIVATQVKDLAEQSAHTVEEIDKIVQDIMAKTRQVLSKATNGNTAVKEGQILTKQVMEGFSNIRSSFDCIDHFVENEVTKAEQVSRIFSQIREQTDNISAISQNHSAATKEMLSGTEEQYADIEIIYQLINSISNSSTKLRKLIE